MNQEFLTLNLDRFSVVPKNESESEGFDLSKQFASVKDSLVNTHSGCPTESNQCVGSSSPLWNTLESLGAASPSKLSSTTEVALSPFQHKFVQPVLQCENRGSDGTDFAYPDDAPLQKTSVNAGEVRSSTSCLAFCNIHVEEEEAGSASGAGARKARKTASVSYTLTETSQPDSNCGTPNSVKRQSYHVYDGGGAAGPHVSVRGDTKSGESAYDPGIGDNVHLSSHSARRIDVPCSPPDASLLPRPQEQIGPPVWGACSERSLATLPPKALVAHTVPDAHSEAKQDIGTTVLARKDSQTPESSALASGGKPPVCVPASPFSSSLDTGSAGNKAGGTKLRWSCSKRFVSCSLRYRSKCRSYKLLALAVCYISTLLVILVHRQLDQGEDNREEDNVHEPRAGEGRTREKRFAGHLALSSIMRNESSCGVQYADGRDEIYIMSYDTFMSGGWVVHVLIGVYTFAAIAAICDLYFVPALEHICEDLKLEADVAGATFMAAASSAPEFCTSVIGIFVQESDVGLGAIVGSSIFNLLAIVGLCAIFAGMPVELSWYPLTRDSIFYTVAVFEMLAFMFDSKVHWYEAFVLIMTYALYILVMVYNKKIEQLAMSMENKSPSTHSSFMVDPHRTQSARLEIIRARSHSKSSSHGLRLSGAHLHTLSTSGAGEEKALEQQHHMRESLVASVQSSAISQQQQQAASVAAASAVTIPALEEPQPLGQSQSRPTSLQHSDTVKGSTSADPMRMTQGEAQAAMPAIEEEHAVAEYENPLEFPEGWLNRAYWLTALPFTALHAYTIPDSRIQDSWQSKFYMIPFTLSVVYLAVYSYIMVWAMSVAAWALKIPVTVTGLTVLAAGTSVPDCLSSIFVARDGYGDMAVSNAIGSNVFDILLCLGVPWLVTGFIDDGHKINSDGMWTAGATLVITIVYLIVSLKLSNWTLTPFYGFCTLLVYVLIIIFCILVELRILNMFGGHKCPPAGAH